MLLKLNAITAVIRGQISLNMRQITCMHFEQMLCFGDIYLDLVGILGIDDISTGRNIHREMLNISGCHSNVFSQTIIKKTKQINKSFTPF